MTIDEIKIEGEEDGFHLIVYTDGEINGSLKNDLQTIRLALDSSNPEALDALVRVVADMSSERITYRIGLPDQFRAEVERTIGRWLSEGEAARNHWHDAYLAHVRSDDPENDPDVRAAFDLARDIERGK